VRVEFVQLRSRVARRIFLEFVLFVFLPLAGLAYLGLVQTTHQLERQAFDRLASSVKDASSSVVERLHARELALEMLLRERAAGDDLGAAGTSEGKAWLASGFESVALAKPEGLTQVIGARGTAPPLAWADRAHLAAKGVALVVRESPDGPRLLLLREMEDLGLGPGLAIGELDLEPLLPVEGLRELALLHEDSLLYSTAPSMFSGAASWSPRGERSVIAMEEQGGERLCSARRIFLTPQYGLDLMVAMAEPRAQVLQPIARFRILFLLSAVLAFLVVLLVSLRRIHTNLVPIQILSEGTARLASGDLDARVEIRTGDEFQGLGEAFNAMAERVHERTRQLIEASSAKSRFLANMSHEIRTPMSSILGYADLCADEGLGAQERNAHLEVIRTSCRHLLRVTGDILDASRIEAGRLEVEKRRCSPVAVLDEALRMIRPQAVEKALALRVRARGPLPETVSTDPDRLRQVLVNLLANAVKFTETGEVVVTVGLEDGAARRLVFAVEDTGPGIPEPVLARLFRPFVQGDDSMSRAKGGTGLGLSIAQSIARLLGGELACTSVVGRGSTFTLSIDPGDLCDVPMRGDASPPAAVPAHSPATGEPLPAARVLVVEDVAVNRLVVVKQLRAAGLTVDEAENGRVALERARLAWRSGAPYAVIFMDMQMPVMDGYEATQRLRQEGYSGPILALTSHAVEGERERCLAAGCDEFVTKPVDRPRLLEVTRRWAGSSLGGAPKARP
jgi:signal transduction histidine kinase/CheY-like chemotaxis protein